MKLVSESIMNHSVLLSLCAASLMVALPAGAGETNQWTLDVSLYGLAAGMSGNVGVKSANTDVDIGFKDVLNNLEFSAMGSVRAGYGRWAFTTEVIYMGLEGSKGGVTANMKQWLVEPTVSYRVSKYFEPLAGVRYNNINAEFHGAGVLPQPVIPSGTQDWWDPIVGANLRLPLGEKFSLNLRGDIGGFSVGSDLTWQVFPYIQWQLAKWVSLQAGYRWLYVDYETGSGADRFKYDMLIQGAQAGVTFYF